jgi:hypothetical protein
MRKPGRGKEAKEKIKTREKFSECENLGARRIAKKRLRPEKSLANAKTSLFEACFPLF